MGGSVGDLLGTGNSGGGGAMPKPQAPWGNTQQSKGDYYNQQLAAGQNDTQIRANVEGNARFGGPQSNSDWSQLIQTAGMQSPTGRPLAGSGQFYQPVFQPQYQNYNMGNPMSISQYGQQPSFGGGFGGGFGSRFGQQPTMFGGQMQGGGYGQFGMNNPFSPFSNSFLNLDPNLNQGTQADKANAYRNAIQSGFGDQQIYNQATGLFGQQSPQAWGYLQGSAMGMTPGLGQGSEQDKIGFYQGARNQGFNDQTIRNAANQMIGNQSQGDWSYLQNRSGFGGGSGGFGNQFMPQMQTPFQQPMQQAQSPFRSSGPSQAIVGRSSQMRGTPNVMRRAEGGITSLLDEA
jgi:hypothetical protein